MPIATLNFTKNVELSSDEFNSLCTSLIGILDRGLELDPTVGKRAIIANVIPYAYVKENNVQHNTLIYLHVELLVGAKRTSALKKQIADELRLALSKAFSSKLQVLGINTQPTVQVSTFDAYSMALKPAIPSAGLISQFTDYRSSNSVGSSSEKANANQVNEQPVVLQP